MGGNQREIPGPCRQPCPGLYPGGRMGQGQCMDFRRAKELCRVRSDALGRRLTLQWCCWRLSKEVGHGKGQRGWGRSLGLTKAGIRCDEAGTISMAKRRNKRATWRCGKGQRQRCRPCLHKRVERGLYTGAYRGRVSLGLGKWGKVTCPGRQASSCRACGWRLKQATSPWLQTHVLTASCF